MATSYESSNQTAVSILKTLAVFPNISQPPGVVLELSNLDRQCPMLMYLVLFYKPSPAYDSLSLDSVFNSLMSGLENTLSVWFPAAGRLLCHQDHQSNGKLNIWCNNEGAILAQATTQAKISEFGDLSQYNEFFENLVYKPSFDGNFSNMPLLVAQVTKFGCGGFSIGIGASHSLFDGPAAYDFFRAWASNSAIAKNKGVTKLQTPVHQRGVLIAPGKCSVPSPSTKTLLTNPRRSAAAIDHLYQLIGQVMAEQNSSQLPTRNYVLKTYHLSSAMVEDLKRKHFSKGAKPNYSKLPNYSSFEVFAAHFWKARTRALGLVSKEKMVCFQFAVDIRTKVAPPLPKGFSGNAYVLASVMMRVRELEEASYEEIVEGIREAKNSVNNEYVKAYMEALEGPHSQASLPPLKELTLVSDWTRMPFHKLEFFDEEAAYAAPLISPVPLASYFMQNPTDSKAVDLRIGLDAENVSAFCNYFFSI